MQEMYSGTTSNTYPGSVVDYWNTNTYVDTSSSTTTHPTTVPSMVTPKRKRIRAKTWDNHMHMFTSIEALNLSSGNIINRSTSTAKPTTTTTSTTTFEDEWTCHNCISSIHPTKTQKPHSASSYDSMDAIMLVLPPTNWCRGQPADVHWQITDPTFHSARVRIEVWNKAWNVPTTIAVDAPNTGTFQWRRVHWGMPIQGDYYLKIFATSDVDCGRTPIVAESPTFWIVQ
jgi:hypothetical protein